MFTAPLSAILICFSSTNACDYVIYERARIGSGTYEAASIFDVNNDGAPDIVHGEYWFEGPDFSASHKICDIQPVGEYYDDFSNYPLDVNGDDYLDIISGGWWGRTIVWRENPGAAGGEWTQRPIAEIGNIERASFWDVDGDGVVEIVPNTPRDPQQILRLVRDEEGRGTGVFEHYTISDSASGHGLGFGDINGDGRPDLVLSGGWLEAPEHPFTEPWLWRPEFNLGSASVPILVHDVDGDGLNDLIAGQAHDYGLAWHKQTQIDGGVRAWIKRDIETGRSQFHAMDLADMNRDGVPELVTGKRWRAHNGLDPGANDPVGVYIYRINKGAFTRCDVDYGPAGEASGVGIYPWIADVDGNGWNDIAAPGKEGLYLFRASFIPTDVTGDGMTTATDVQQTILAALDQIVLPGSDINGDSVTNSVDVQLVILGALFQR